MLSPTRRIAGTRRGGHCYGRTLDAWFARAYGLTRDELRYILDPADVHGPDFPGETFRVLKEKETAKFGEYRTRRLVLEAWDRWQSGEREPGMEVLENA